MNYRKCYFYGHTGDKNARGWVSFLFNAEGADRQTDRERQQRIIMDCQAFGNTNVNDLNVIIATNSKTRRK